jgi:cation:H+ antiporter
MIYLQLVASLGLLLVGGELLVRGAVAIARRLGTSELMIGLTLVGFGTSTPELVTSLDAALVGAPGIAVGNVVGSNIANILLILGVGALIMPMHTTREAFRRDGPVLLGASVLLVGACVLEVIPRAVGALFLGLLLAYTCYTYWTERAATNASAAMHAAEADALGRVPVGLGTALASALGGLAGVLIGASLLVEAAIGIAQTWGVSDAVIGLTIVAVGTSLPELATTVVAALRRQADVAFGNIVGSNIFNILGIVGTTALITPLAVPPSIAGLDVWVMLAAAIVGSGFAMSGWRVNRLEGGLLLLAYLAYLLLVVG